MRYEIELDTVLHEIMARWGIPGMGIGLVEGDEIAYAKGFGVQSLESGAFVTPGSVFCVASVAKCFVASAVMQLAEQGKIQLDAPLVQYLPLFKLDDERYSLITIRQMLSHTSGMPDMDEIEYDELVAHPEYDDGSAERYVQGLSTRQLIAAPGERFAYSNIAYNVLGFLVARLSGQTFEAFMKEHILIPAGMPDSTFFYPEVPQARLALPHLRSPAMIVNPLYPYHRADAPASFLHTTVVDMCHWAITCLNGGTFHGRQVLSPTSYDQMWTPVAPRHYPPFYESAGLGWTIGHFEGVKTVSHGGGGFGWTAFFLLLPEKKRGAVILCNEESPARECTIQAVARVMLDHEPQAGAVSWMVPVCQALQEGGIRAAYARYAKLKASSPQEYVFDEDDLVSLTYQLVSAKKVDLAIDVLELNIHVFPEHLGSLVFLAKLYIRQGQRVQAEERLQKALSIKPDSMYLAGLLDEIRCAAKPGPP